MENLKINLLLKHIVVKKLGFLSYIIALFFAPNFIAAQVGIGTNSPSASSVLDVESTTKGFLYPRMSNTQMLAIASPAAGLMVFNTDAGALYSFDGNSFMYLQSAANFLYYGSVQRCFINDQTNNKCYRITCIFGSSYLKNTIEIERVY